MVASTPGSPAGTRSDRAAIALVCFALLNAAALAWSSAGLQDGEESPRGRGGARALLKEFTAAQRARPRAARCCGLAMPLPRFRLHSSDPAPGPPA